MHDRGAEDPALRVDEHLEEVVFGRSVADRPVVVCERGAEDAMGNALLLRLPFAEAHVRDLGVGVRDPGRVETSEARATGDSVFLRTMPA
jgi:hypothetical protein